MASCLLLLRAVPPHPQLAHLHTCHSGASGEMCRAFRTSGEFRYMLGAVELVQGGSIRTFFRATGIRNRFWESHESLSQQHLPHGVAAFCPSCPQQHNWLDRGCSQPSSMSTSAHLPPGEPQWHPDEGVAQVMCDEIITLVPVARASMKTD